ncbi:LysR substrate-binding domain-containing protein [Bosea sp. PAMC 26642]|uniref:LysR substrate-binding domain-containing protein n=1 Tax=Bosea sp. (strain PAMC 26642) TaxID=1792307 RepID=UPI001F208BE6|nr:LysR substrate-binding domain-containing protein [Bosea sp. PAMC 26642]
MPLFERSKGRLQPTYNSTILYGEVASIFKSIQNLQHSMARMSAGDDMTLRIGSSPSLAARIVPRAMLKLRKRYPKLIMRLDTLSVAQVNDYLLFGEGEMVVGLFKQDHPALSTQLLGSGEIVAVLPEGQAAAYPADAVSDVADLLRGSLIGFEPTTPHGQAISEYLAARGIRYEPDTIVRFAEAACQMVQVGLGFAFVDSFTAASFEWAGFAIRKLPDAPRMNVFVHVHVERGLSSFGRMLKEAVRAEVEGELSRFANATSAGNRDQPSSMAP